MAWGQKACMVCERSGVLRVLINLALCVLIPMLWCCHFNRNAPFALPFLPAHRCVLFLYVKRLYSSLNIMSLVAAEKKKKQEKQKREK